ncbi:hypothetical protein M404DRAFT_994946 [Pisolithus tinctorius Marx 270]|uniref:Uncharacterized protein n=1 Tax=Pisolithus tinctorius Marx 270 TaxID=870435 RepID=A0A0C3PQJ4_PISTI|nr:hypothetical protein M404DRAFT_994946 [Pisolithus tinctorius Marx 270]
MTTTATQAQYCASPPVSRFYARGSLPMGSSSGDTGKESSRVSTHAEPSLLNWLTLSSPGIYCQFMWPPCKCI